MKKRADKDNLKRRGQPPLGVAATEDGLRDFLAGDRNVTAKRTWATILLAVVLVAAGGLFHTSAGMPFLVTRGVGMEGDYAPRFRFNCRPHIFLLTLRGPASLGRNGGAPKAL